MQDPRDVALRGALEAIREGALEVTLPVVGRSMHPILESGDRVTVDPRLKPRVGSIIAFQRAGAIFIHRVLAAQQGGRFTEMGDATSSSGQVDAAEILGVAVRVLTNEGREIDLTSRVASTHARFAALWLRSALPLVGSLRRYLGYVPRLLALGLRGWGARIGTESSSEVT